MHRRPDEHAVILPRYGGGTVKRDLPSRCDDSAVTPLGLRPDYAAIIAKPSSSPILHEGRLVIDALGIGHRHKTARVCFPAGTLPGDLGSVNDEPGVVLSQGLG